MFSVANLLDAAKANGKIESDYRLAKVIGITHSVISGYRSGKSMPNEKILEQLCALSGDDLAVVAAQVQAERSQSPEAKTMWMMVAKRLAGGASTAILSVCFAIALVAGFASPSQAAQDGHTQKSKLDFLYIVSNAFLSVNGFLMVRLRRFPLFFRLWLFALA